MNSSDDRPFCKSVLGRLLLASVAAVALAGCATLPTSGPTGSDIRAQIAKDAGKLGITLVQVQSVNELPHPPAPPAPFRPDYTPPPSTELVGPGDVLNVAIFETGVALFGRTAAIGTEGSSNFDAASRAERFPPLRVSDQGTITIPYVGQVNVAGRTTREIELQLRQALRGKSQNPQVLVSIAEGLTNSVIIGGDVARPGRLVLPTNREKLSEVIALAGGNKGEIRDLVVRVSRNEEVQEWRLSDVLDNPAIDLRIFPADRITLIRQPRSFTVLGAPGQTSQFAFPSAKTSLIEAIAMAGGANPNAGNARAIFVFRIDRDETGKEVPIVYHFNMMQASSYILAQKFDMKDKDVVYVGNALANQPSKLIQVLSQLFFPLVALQQAGAI
jgi:polysaccharide export outer membrane protein